MYDQTSIKNKSPNWNSRLKSPLTFKIGKNKIVLTVLQKAGNKRGR